MVIKFQRKYKVTPFPTTSGKIIIDVEVPKNAYGATRALLVKQDWVRDVIAPPSSPITVYVNGAYDITEAQAVDALERLCAFVVSPQDDVEQNEITTPELSEVSLGGGVRATFDGRSVILTTNNGKNVIFVDEHVLHNLVKYGAKVWHKGGG